MEAIYSRALIEGEAADAADAGKPLASACRWPLGSAAADVFKEAYDKRIEQLNKMAEVA